MADLNTRRLRRLHRLAALVLAWEALWRTGWPLPALAAAASGLALMDVLPLLPGWLHALLLVLLIGGMGLAAWRIRRIWQVRRPGVADIRRRLEGDSGLAHRPLSMLADRLASGRNDPAATTLWQTERRRLAGLLGQLRLRPPQPVLAAADPLGLRFAALLLLAIGLAAGRHDAADRLIRAITPNLTMPGGPPPLLQVWVTPPAFTGLPPIILAAEPAAAPTAEPLAVPAGSTLLAELQGGWGQGELLLDDQVLPFARQGDDSQKLETALAKGEHLNIRQGFRSLGSWRLNLLAARPPIIQFAQPPLADAEGRLKFEVDAHDDYGVTRAWADMRRLDTPDGEPFQIPLPLAGSHPKDSRRTAWQDLTGHPWAGLAVTIRPHAENSAGLTAAGEAVSLTLPERRFTHPVAQAIIGLRRRLADDPAERSAVADALDDIAARPHAFGGDRLAELALSVAAARLRYDGSQSGLPSVMDLLWDTAMGIEEGGRLKARNDLDEAARALEKALAEGASEQEIDALMSQLQAAIAQYLQALVEQARRQGAEDMPLADPDQRVITTDDLSGMMERMRDLSRTGSRQAAADLLGQMRQLLEGLQIPGQGGLSAQQAEQARQTMADLQSLAEDQRDLLDQTFRNHRQGAAEDEKNPKAAARQDALRRRLGKAMQSLGDLGADLPDALGQAEQAMRDSGQALGQGQGQAAIDAQSEALARLQEGSRQAMQALARRMGGGMAKGGGMPGRDPLGRPLGRGPMDDGTVKIPEQADVQKARETLDELRRRAGQTLRPAPERDYLQRLLKQFY